MCQTTYNLTVKEQDHIEWQKGKGPKRHAQVAFPYLTAGERELLISETCDDCFQKLFPPEEED